MNNDYIYTKLQILLEVLAHLYYSSSYVKNHSISEKLGINSRSVRRIIEELRQLGYNIEAKMGKDGGYKLLKGNLFLPIIIEEKYRLAWNELVTHIQSSKNLANYDTIMSLIEVMSLNSQQDTNINYSFFDTFQLNPNIRQRINYTHLVFDEAIKSQKRVIVVYEDAKGNVSDEREFIPYKLQIYNRSYYIKGHYHNEKRLRTLRLSRFIKVVLTNKKFIIENLEDNDHSIPFSSEIFKRIEVKLKVHKNRNDLKDYIYGDNQEITNEGDYFILSCTMHGDYVVKNFVLSIGKDIEVLEPKWLRDEVYKEINAMKLLY